MRKFFTWKKIVFIYLPIIVVGGLSAFALTREKPSPYQFAEAQVKDLLYQVEVTGNVEKAAEFELRFKNSGKISRVNVSVGQEVTEGAVLIQQENNDLSSQIIDARASLQVAQAQLVQAQNPFSPSQVQVAQTAYENELSNLEDVREKAALDLKHDLDSALASLEQADSKVEKSLLLTVKEMKNRYFLKLDQNGSAINNLETEARKSYLGDATFNLLGAAELLSRALAKPNDQDAVETALDKMKEALTNTRRALTTMRSAMDDTDYSVTATDKATVDTEITAMNTQIDNLVAAKQAIASQETTNANNINTAQAKVRSALEELELKKAGAHQPDVRVAEARVAQAQANLFALQSKARDAQIIAPQKGIITEVNVKRGETAQGNEIAVKMNGVSDTQIEAEVSEVDIAFLEVGDPVEITLDAFPYGELWEGKVLKIDPAQTMIQDVVYYGITIGFSLEDERVKPGMTANLTITTDIRENVLAIPQRAVIEKDGGTFVRIADQANGGYQEKAVTLGMRASDGEVEILSGLEEGKRVIISLNGK